jgi:hypothetical protein
MSELQQIIPKPALPDKPYRSPEQHWEEVVRDIYQDTNVPENITFKHDEKWSRRFWSVQNALDQYNGHRFGFWTIIGLIFFSTPFLGGWGRTFRLR